MSAPKDVVAIFDVGKTNKKLLLLDQWYRPVHEESIQLPQSTDDDGFPCEDVHALAEWVSLSLEKLTKNTGYTIRAINFSAYGASLVYLDEKGEVALPLYNYLKPYPPALQQSLYDAHGGAHIVARQTASPVLGSLNSGMQLYRVRQEKPEIFARIKWALHLPQFLSYVVTGAAHSDITSIGCHTQLWDFQYNKYHDWVFKEQLDRVLAPIVPFDTIAGYFGKLPVGVGLHDSSAALLPYLVAFREPFVLISTGTWCITLNPFNQSQLTNNELNQDCLCYLSYEGRGVKASRLFAGYEHEQEVKRIAAFFGTPADQYKAVRFDSRLVQDFNALTRNASSLQARPMLERSAFAGRDLATFASYEEAYHRLLTDIIIQQVQSTNLVLKGTGVKRIFVDGGFSNNDIYMNLLARAFRGTEVYAASVPQASAIGAALAMHRHWNKNALPSDLIQLKAYHLSQERTQTL